MRLRTLALTLLAATLALSGCASSTTPAATETPSTAPNTASSAPVAAALVVSLTDIEVQAADGSTISSTPLSDGIGTLDFLTGVFGAEPSAEESELGYPTTTYAWGDVSIVVVDDGPASVSFATDSADGLSLATTGGVHVGSSVAEAQAAGALFPDSGLTDVMRLDITEAPGTTSLENDGATGIDFIMLVIENDVVARISSPSNDYGDL
ncbi:hypothetical protein FHX49_001852 [Microbacterium endophyticum]|uniref:Uncharacterized protein n=1 Tax=Microbacterium endophyticum TaxID=1526412 RepID=A0A7W4V4X6_9MICO|nr:hypothetical protein [Microbacterium endophyticum]MBB2976278.1 hypothetical protein [Microbacterium endophyticum]NIK35158.1 hypothetical protein [Microbacterium endophyticum]